MDGYEPLAATGKHVETHQMASLPQVTANLITAGLGAGILSLPWAMAGASVIPSIGTVILVMVLNTATVMILVEAAERFQAFDLGLLLKHVPGGWGRFAQITCNTMTWASIYLCLVSYVVVVADALEPFLCEVLRIQHAHKSTAACGLLGPRKWLIRGPLLALGSLGALPLCFLDQRHLAFSSTLGIGLNLYLFVMVAGFLFDDGVAEHCCWVGMSKGTITMFSTLMQCAIIQMCVLPMYEEMENRTPRRFGVAVVIAFTFLAVLFSVFAAVSYLSFGPGVHPNVIQDFPWDTNGRVARVGLVVAILVAYPLILVSMVAPVRHWEENRGIGNHNASHAATVWIVVFTGLGAAFFDKLGPLNTINGALQVGCFIGVVPGLAGLCLVDRRGVLWRALMYGLIVFSLAASVLGFLYTTTDPQGLAASCWWAGDR